MTNDLQELKNLSEEEQKVALEILKQLSETGNSSLMNDLKYSDFEEIPVDVVTFLHDKKYLGNGLYDPEGRFTLFPYWEEKLKEIFPDNLTTAYNTLILTGAIGIGKTLVSVCCLLYMLYRLLCLKDPYLYYGLQPIDKISISLMNITLDAARGVALDKMNQMILSSEWFMSHGEMSGETNLTFRPNKHIELITASSNNQVIGRCLDGDTNIVTTDGVFKIKDLVGKHINVLSVDNDKNIIISDKCFVEQTAESDEIISIELEDGTEIRCTKNHRFMLKDGTYKEAQFLTESDELFDKINTGSKGVINL